VRRTLPVLLLSLALAGGLTACGDKTVTSSPPSAPAVVSDATGTADAADAELVEVDQLVRDIEADLRAVDQDAAASEGDPTE
jgi:hypothetical protein